VSSRFFLTGGKGPAGCSHWDGERDDPVGPRGEGDGPRWARPREGGRETDQAPEESLIRPRSRFFPRSNRMPAASAGVLPSPWCVLT
jgi:hypothetical protein